MSKSALPLFLSYLAIFVVTIIWGAQHAFIKGAVAHGDILEAAVLNFLRFGLAFVCFLPWFPGCPARLRQLTSVPVDTAFETELRSAVAGVTSSEDEGAARVQANIVTMEWYGGFELGICQFLGFSLQAWGMLYTTAQRSCLLLYLNVKLVPFFACACYGKSVSLTTWLSACLALTGTVLLVAGDAHDGSSSDEHVPPGVGDALSLLAAVASALFILRVERYAPCTRSASLSAVCMLLVTIMCAVWAFVAAMSAEFAEIHDAQRHTSHAIQRALLLLATRAEHMVVSIPITLLYLGTVTTGFASWLQVVAQRHVPATSAAVIYALDPLWGCLVAYLWLGEKLGDLGFVGCSLIMIAVVGQLVAVRSQPEQSDDAEAT